MDEHLKEDVQAAGNGRAFGITRDRRKKKSFLPLQHRNNERFSQKNAVMRTSPSFRRTRNRHRPHSFRRARDAAHGDKMNKAYIRFKYTVDFLIALIALVAVSPIMIAVAIAIKAEDGGKVMFKQLRTGKQGKKFYCYKFRSMRSTEVKFDKDHPVISDKNANVTKVGKIIRKFKIDELPQLLNVLKGDMCFIAPRPLLPVYDSDYKDWELLKFEMRPGLTGLGQVNGNGYLSIEDRKYYDAYYVMHASLLMDIKIILKTIAVIFKGEEKFLHPVTEKQYAALKREIKIKYSSNTIICAELKLQGANK